MNHSYPETPRFITLAVFVMAAALSRVVPHSWNMTPVAAIALFAGAQFSDRWAAFLVPLIGMLISDAVLGFYPTLPVTYLSLALIVLIGRTLRERKSFARVGGAVVASSLLFFVITNFACWLTMPEYTKDVSGFVLCYQRALPFFRGTLMGDMFFSAILFGGFSLSEKAFPVLREQPQTA